MYSFAAMGKSTMAEKTAPQYNSYISCSAGKLALQSYFRETWDGGEGVDGAESVGGGGGEGAGNSTI